MAVADGLLASALAVNSVKREGDLDEEVRATLGELGYPATLAASTDQEFLAPLVSGARVVAEGEYIAVARHVDKTCQQTFKVQSGNDREIEVLTGQCETPCATSIRVVRSHDRTLR